MLAWDLNMSLGTFAVKSSHQRFSVKLDVLQRFTGKHLRCSKKNNKKRL